VNLRGLITVLRKETKENIRDRRAIFNSLLLGPLLFPLMFIGIVWFTTSAEQERFEAVLEIPVVGAERAPSLVRFLEQHGVVIKPAPEDPEGMVRRQEVMVVVRIPERFEERWTNGEPAPVEVISDPSRQESQVTIRRVKALLAGYGQQIGMLRLQLRGIAPQLSSAILIRDVDLSTAKSRAILAMISVRDPRARGPEGKSDLQRRRSDLPRRPGPIVRSRHGRPRLSVDHAP
jgi:sodium transport system permease protein